MCTPRRAVIAAWAAILLMLAVPVPARASNPALLRLLQVLRDRGSISVQEYEEIRAVAEAPDTPGPAAAAGTTTAKDLEQDKAIAEVKAATSGTPAPVVQAALAGKWYERLSIRGYSQLRYSEVEAGTGAALEIPADRSVNANESFQLRRGRVVIQGDVAPHLSLYAQSDFAGSTGSGDFAVQMRDLYGDVWLDGAKTYRIRLGQSKVPYGFVNMQSSSNRAPFERPDGMNSAVEGERDLGATLMWAGTTAKQRFRELANARLKGSGDYGVLAIGAYSGQGLNRSDQNGDPHVVVRAAYPFRTRSGRFYELGVQAYRGHFIAPTQSIASGGATFTPTQGRSGVLDQRVGVTAVLFPQPFGIEAEWNVGKGPQIADDLRSITSQSLHGGYVQFSYRANNAFGTWLPFTRWQYYNGARKFARNAPADRVNELDFGVEFAKWAEVEVTGLFTHTFRRTRTSAFPFAETRGANRVGLQVQWNY